MLEKRLLRKRIDIVIQGTIKSAYRGGIYEGSRGFTYLKTPPKNTNTAIFVKLGLEETKIKVPIKYLFPETTTDRGRLTTDNKVKPISTINGTRVVIIGADSEGSTDFIGTLGGVVVGHLRELQPLQVVVSIFAAKQHVYFPVQSLCRSYEGPFTWDGELFE